MAVQRPEQFGERIRQKPGVLLGHDANGRTAPRRSQRQRDAGTTSGETEAASAHPSRTSPKRSVRAYRALPSTDRFT
jgi:hypothetical protein